MINGNSTEQAELPSEQPSEKKTLIEEINELEKTFASLETSLVDTKDKQYEILRKLIPRQNAFFKGIVTKQQTDIKRLEEELSKYKNSKVEEIIDSSRENNLSKTM